MEDLRTPSLIHRPDHIAEEQEGALIFPKALPGLADDRGIPHLHGIHIVIERLLMRNTTEDLIENILSDLPLSKASRYRPLQKIAKLTDGH